jgi:hypothetical protein
MASTHLWTDVSDPAALVEGQIAKGNPALVLSKIAEGAIRPGLLVERGTSDDQVKPLAALPSADVDSIMTASKLTSTAGIQIFKGTDLDGAIGAGKIFPPQALNCVFNSHADWDATTMLIVGLDADGHRTWDEIIVPDAGNATVDTTYGRAFSQILTVELPAQAGTNGTATLGTVVDQALDLSTRNCGVAVYDSAREPSTTATVQFDDEDSLSVMYEGFIAVVTETNVVPGDLVGVRHVLDGTDVRGQFAKMPSEDPASMTMSLLVGATWESTTAADAVGVVRLRG